MSSRWLLLSCQWRIQELSIKRGGWGVASRAWRVLHITAMCTWSLGVGGHPQHRMLACCTSSACCWFILMSLTCYTPRLCLPVCVRVPGLKIKRVHTSIRAIVCSGTVIIITRAWASTRVYYNEDWPIGLVGERNKLSSSFVFPGALRGLTTPW